MLYTSHSKRWWILSQSCSALGFLLLHVRIARNLLFIHIFRVYTQSLVQLLRLWHEENIAKVS